jgi:hypothetical protein
MGAQEGKGTVVYGSALPHPTEWEQLHYLITISKKKHLAFREKELRLQKLPATACSKASWATQGIY